MDEDSFGDFKCPYCGGSISFPERDIGTARDCPMCMQSVIVPEKGIEIAGKLPLPIRTPRLLLRRLKPDDWKDLLEFMSDETLFQYIDWSPLDEEGVLGWLEADRSARLTDDRRTLSVAIELAANSKVIGCATISYRDDIHLQISFTVLVSRNFQRKGYGTETACGLMDFGFRGLNLHRVTAQCDNRDVAGCRMAEKAGLRREGEFLKDRAINGEWVSTIYFGLLAEEYHAGAAAAPNGK